MIYTYRNTLVYNAVMETNAKTLILGGAGFIGSHLADRLLTTGREVHVLDSMRYCYAGNLATAERSQKFHLHVQSASDNLIGFLSRRDVPKFDEIYHLAGLVSTDDFVSNPQEAFLVSILPLLDLFEYQNKYPYTRLLFTSSSEVYGNPPVIPTPEDCFGSVDFCGPRSGYDEGKRSGESLISAHIRNGGTCARVRLFNTFGPRMRANGRLVPTMVRSALVDGRITINGTGEFTRTLLWVGDCLDALVMAMDRQSELPFNIGGLVMSSISEIASKIAERVDLVSGREKVVVEHTDPIQHDVFQRQPDISRARDVLGWSPSTSVEYGVDRTIQYWRGRLMRTEALYFNREVEGSFDAQLG